MTSKQSQLRIRQLHIRAWFHAVSSVIYVSGALLCVIKQSMIGALLFLAFTAMSVWIVVRSAAELSQLKDPELDVGHGVSNHNMTPNESKSRIRGLRIRVWLSIVAAAISTSIALIFAVKQNLVVALPLIGLAAGSARIIIRSAEELSRLPDHEPEA